MSQAEITNEGDDYVWGGILMDKKPTLGSHPLEWIIIIGLRYYSILLIICLSFLFYFYADLTIVKLVIIGVTIGSALLIKKGVVLDLEDLSKRIRSLEEKYKDIKGGDWYAKEKKS
jgi:hypothetical protein